MPTIESYFEHADELAQEVVNAWGVNVDAGNASLLSLEFKSLLDKACNYRDAKKTADSFREQDRETELHTANENARRQEFVEAYRTFHEKQER